MCEAAGFLNASEKTILRMIYGGEIVAFPLRNKRGSALRIPRRSLEDYVARQIARYSLERQILGVRNLQCPEYKTCLDRAAKQNLQDFSCFGCEHERTSVDI